MSGSGSVHDGDDRKKVVVGGQAKGAWKVEGRVMAMNRVRVGVVWTS